LAGEQKPPSVVSAEIRLTGALAPSERTTTSPRTLVRARSGIIEIPIPVAMKPWIAL
jgi:hypothetical protein